MRPSPSTFAADILIHPGGDSRGQRTTIAVTQQSGSSRGKWLDIGFSGTHSLAAGEALRYQPSGHERHESHERDTKKSKTRKTRKREDRMICFVLPGNSCVSRCGLGPEA